MRGIIFDLDDTLYSREQFVQSGFAAVANDVAANWRRDREAVLATLRRAHDDGHEGRELQALCAEHRLPLSAVPALVELFRSHTPSITLSPSVDAMLRRLRQDGWRLAILTNGHPAVQRRKIAALNLEPLVDCVSYAEEHTGRGKPDALVFLATLERLGVTPSRGIHVGDDPFCDIAGARAVGLWTVHVLAPSRTARAGAENARYCGADATVDSVLRVPSVVASLLRETSHVA